MSTLEPDQARKLYRDLLLIREFELSLDRLFAKGVIRGTAHFCVGQEASAVGVAAALRPGDYVISYHRGHGHFLALGGDPRRIMAELYGKATGYSGGRGGSQHIACFEIGFLGSNGITGGGLPVGTGAALALKLQQKDGVVVVFFGDGAANQGSFHESLNLGALWDLPVVYICENNLYSMFTHISESTSVSDIAVRAAGYGMPGVTVDGNDVFEVLEATEQAVARARAGEGPSLIECKTYRQLGHSKSDKREYRTRDEEREWEARDPIQSYRAHLLDNGLAREDELSAIDEEVAREMEEAIKFAEESPLPSTEDLGASIFA